MATFFSPHSDIEKEMLRLVSEAQHQGINLRLIGGLGVKVRCMSTLLFNPDRVYNDMDLVTDAEGGRKMGGFFTGLGYGQDRTLNLLNGDRRQLYFDDQQGWQVDVFVGDFLMCHKIPFGKRLIMDEITVPLAELFLTKAQIVELNQKDAHDLLALLLDHSLGEGDGERINQKVIQELCARDWGLYTTVQLNLGKLDDLVKQFDGVLTGLQAKKILTGIKNLKESIEAAPKTQSWKMRSMVGKRMRWYEEVEEVRR